MFHVGRFKTTQHEAAYMIDTRRARIVAVAVLLAAHVALFPAFAAQPVNQDAGVLPGEEEFLNSPDQYLGTQIETGGIVVEQSPLTIRVETTRRTEELHVRGLETTPEPDDKIRVAGTLREPTIIEAQRGFVVPQRGRWYAWGISFLAGLWVLARLVRHWRVEYATLGFVPRHRSLTIRDIAWWTREDEGGDDA